MKLPKISAYVQREFDNETWNPFDSWMRLRSTRYQGVAAETVAQYNPSFLAWLATLPTVTPEQKKAVRLIPIKARSKGRP